MMRLEAPDRGTGKAAFVEFFQPDYGFKNFSQKLVMPPAPLPRTGGVFERCFSIRQDISGVALSLRTLQPPITIDVALETKSHW